MMWSEVYRPRTVEQMFGNEDARINVIKWLSKWIDGARPLLLVGPSGVGKTTLVKLLALKFDYDLVEMNASDTRNKIDLERLILPLFNNKSVSGRKVLLFLDEVDGISGREDLGGLEYLIKIMKESTIPVIMAANTQDNAKIKQLSKVCKTVKFSPVPPRILAIFLDYVLRSHDKKLDVKEKKLVIDRSNGDIRALLNNAQAKVAGYDAVANDVSEIDIATAINGYFSSINSLEAMNYISHANATYSDPRFGMSSDERRKDKLNAFFSSIVSSRIRYDSIASLLDVLSKVDLVVGRMAKNRRWSLLRYIDYMIAYGLFENSRKLGLKYNQYSMIWPIMAPISARGQLMKNLLLKFALKTHTSKSIFGSLYLPYLVKIMHDNNIDPRELVVELNLDQKEGEALARELEIMAKKDR
ncbi:AAA family ATPase [Nitrososphaera sp. AFS]|nr:AAA family ATPase [Nitrososphaera sp. AFS]